MIRDMKDPARSANYWETAKAEKLALSSKAPWVGVEGQFDGHPEWDDANQKPYSVLKYKLILGMDGNPLPGVPPPQRQQAVEVEAGFKEAAESGLRNLMAVAGMPHDPTQDAPGSVVSGIALRRRQAISDMAHYQFYDNQTMFISHIGEICLDLIPYYYSQEKMQRIIGEDGVPSMVAINQPRPNPSTGVMELSHNMTVGKYDVVMDTGPGYETKRQEGAENMLDLLRTPLAEPIAKTGADLIVRNMDFAGAEDLADRLMPLNEQGMQKAMENLPHEAKGIVQALQIQNQQLQQELQKTQMELKYKVTTEQGWMQVEREKMHVAAVTKVHDTDRRAQTTLEAAEIKEAGSLLDTHVQGKYDAAARKDELAAAKQAERDKPSNGAS